VQMEIADWASGKPSELEVSELPRWIRNCERFPFDCHQREWLNLFSYFDLHLQLLTFPRNINPRILP
jgi:hypothetical protein